MVTSTGHHSRPLSTFPLGPSVLVQLARCGYTTEDDLPPEIFSADAEQGARVLAQVLQNHGGEPVKSLEISKVTLDAVSRAEYPDDENGAWGDDTIGKGQLPAFSLYGAKACWLQRDHSRPKIITLCKALDMLLGGGAAMQQVLEIAGKPGAGKTAIAMQLAVNVQLPPSLTGVAGEALYLDTEAGFTAERAAQMADGIVKHLFTLRNLTPRQHDAVRELSIDRILAGIRVQRIHSWEELVAVVHLLPAYLRKYPNVKLVVVDSISFLFRGMEDLSIRQQMVMAVGHGLSTIAYFEQISVVIVNQLTTKIDGRGDNDLSWFQPALGESWSNLAGTRLLLDTQGQNRQAFLEKSAWLPSDGAQFSISQDGVRQCDAA